MSDGSGPPTFTACVVADDEHLLLLRRAFSHRVEPGAWTTSLRGHLGAGEQPADAARRQALRLLGLRLDDVRTVLPTYPGNSVAVPTTERTTTERTTTERTTTERTATDRAAADRAVTDQAACVLVARVRRRVVVPDPTHFDEAEWVQWDGLVTSVRAGTLPVAAWSAAQVEQLAALGSPSRTWGGAPAGDRVTG